MRVMIAQPGSAVQVALSSGYEGCISFLKRCFGLRRCTWVGLDGFKSYVWGSIIAANLLILARHRLE